MRRRSLRPDWHLWHYYIIKYDIFRSAFVAPPPDFLLLGGADQLLPEIRMGNFDQRLGPLPGGFAGQLRDAVLSHDAGRLGAGRGDNVALGELGKDAGMNLARFVGEGRMHGEKGPAMLGLQGAGDEVQLAAGAGDLPRAGGFAAHLAVEIHGDAAVDGHKIIQLPDGLGAVHIAHRRGEDFLVVIQKVIELPGAVADRENSLAGIKFFVSVGDFSRPIEVEITVAHEFGVHAQIFDVRLGDQRADGVGDAADAQLQRGAAGDKGQDMRRDLPIQLRGQRTRHRGNRPVTLHDTVHILNMDPAALDAPGHRHGGVDLDDDRFCRLQQFLHGAVGEAEGKIALLIHGRHRDHGHIHRRVALAVIAAAVAKEHRRVIGQPPVNILPVEAGAVPEIIGKGMARVVLHRGHRQHGDGIADLHVPQLARTGGQSPVQRLGEGAGLAVIHPVPVLDQLDCLLRRANFFSIKRPVIHGDSPFP